MAAGGACSAWAGQAHHLTVLDQVAVNQITWMAAAAVAASKHPLWLVGKEGRQTQPLEWEEEEGGGMYLPTQTSATVTRPARPQLPPSLPAWPCCPWH